MFTFNLKFSSSEYLITSTMIDSDYIIRSILVLSIYIRDGRQQLSGSTVCNVDWFWLWLDRGTSLDGFTSKKLAGFRDMTNFSTGMTGKSASSQ
jgi:hypothetical protein